MFHRTHMLKTFVESMGVMMCLFIIAVCLFYRVRFSLASIVKPY